jgi:hypothetical protein
MCDSIVDWVSDIQCPFDVATLVGLHLTNSNYCIPFAVDLIVALSIITADVSTEGADRKFLFWDVSKEFPISLSVLH